MDPVLAAHHVDPGLTPRRFELAGLRTASVRDMMVRVMRTTLDIDDDVLAAAKDLSRQQGQTAGQVVSTLLRRALAGGAVVGAHPSAHEQITVGGFRPFVSRGSPVTNAGIDALRDAEGT